MSRPPDPHDEPSAPLVVDEVDEVDEEVQNDAIIGTALRWSAVALLAIGLGVAVMLLLRGGEEAAPTQEIPVTAPRNAAELEPASPPGVTWTDVTLEAGIDFVHENGARGERFLPETMGGGGAFVDYDDDGDQDLVLVNSTTWEAASGPTSALYENDGRGRFADKSRESGLAISMYGTGIAVGDYDNDGWVDLFLAAVGTNRLLRNQAGEGSSRVYRDVTAAAGVAGSPDEWSSSSAFFDADGDGDLDLFVGNYVRWSPQIDREVGYTLTGIGRAYGQPLNYQGTFPYLYRNNGDGTFTDISAQGGVQVTNAATGEPVAKTLGVLPSDVDLDGDVDLVVANDTVRNFFFQNRGDGHFEEVGELLGVAYGRDGNATGAMGIDAADYRNDGSLGFVIGNFANEMTSLYVSQGDASLFADEAIGEGIGAPSRRSLSFGVFFFDYDLDGRLDLLQVNGHLEEEIALVDPSQSYRQPAQLFWNAGDRGARTFVPITEEALGGLGTEVVGRGSAYADIDGDGDLDVLLLQTGDRPLLVRNEGGSDSHWLRIRLRGNGITTNRDAIGARVEIVVAGVRQRREVIPSRSYQSQSEGVVTFGLGTAELVDELLVVWPDGARETRENLAVDRLLEVVQASSGR